MRWGPRQEWHIWVSGQEAANQICRSPRGPFSLEPSRELPSCESQLGFETEPHHGKLQAVGAGPKGIGVPGPPHPKARFVPKGTGLKTMGDGSRMGRRDRRGRQGSRVHSNRHARVEERTTGTARAAGKKRHSWCPPAGWASLLPGEGSSPSCPGRDSNHSWEPGDQPCTRQGWALWPGVWNPAGKE